MNIEKPKFIYPDKQKTTEERLYSAAFRLGQTRSTTNFSVKELCEEAGIHPQTFYLHFSSKLEFYKKISIKIADFLLHYFQYIFQKGDGLDSDDLKELKSIRKALYITLRKDSYRVEILDSIFQELIKKLSLPTENSVFLLYGILGLVMNTEEQKQFDFCRIRSLVLNLLEGGKSEEKGN